MVSFDINLKNKFFLFLNQYLQFYKIFLLPNFKYVILKSKILKKGKIYEKK